MKTKYSVSFSGRDKNALGITYRITAEVEAENEQAALIALYDNTNI